MSASPHILLTGHRGFIGSALKEALLAAYPDRVFPLAADLTNAAELTTEVEALPVDRVLVLHLATINRRACQSHEGHAANTAMLVNLLRATASCAERQVLFASSTDVFGVPRSFPLTESSPHHPQDWYAHSKSTAEWILQQEAVPHAILRLPGVFGARVNERSLLAQLLRRGLETGRVTLHARGEVLRDFIYLDDLVALVLDWVRSPRPGVWNVASGISAPLATTLGHLCALCGATFELQLEAQRTPRDFDLVFDPSALRASFPASPIRPSATTAPLYATARSELHQPLSS